MNILRLRCLQLMPQTIGFRAIHLHPHSVRIPTESYRSIPKERLAFAPPFAKLVASAGRGPDQSVTVSSAALRPSPNDVARRPIDARDRYGSPLGSSENIAQIASREDPHAGGRRGAGPSTFSAPVEGFRPCHVGRSRGAFLKPDHSYPNPKFRSPPG